LLNVLVQIDAKEYSEEAEEIDFQRKAKGELDEDEIDS
jgi:uncharacterized membrane protein